MDDKNILDKETIACIIEELQEMGCDETFIECVLEELEEGETSMSTVGKDEIRLTAKQISEMKHALGSRVCHRLKDSYRNYYNTDTKDESWEELVELGLATCYDGAEDHMGVYYYVSDKGIEWLMRIE